MKAATKMGMKKAAMKKAAMKKAAMKKVSMKKVAKKKRISVIAKGVRARAVVFSGKKQKTASGLSISDLVKSKTGKIVSKKMSANAKRRYPNSGLKKWADACKKARKELGITGFVAIGGKSVQGKTLYAKVKSLLQ